VQGDTTALLFVRARHVVGGPYEILVVLLVGRIGSWLRAGGEHLDGRFLLEHVEDGLIDGQFDPLVLLQYGRKTRFIA
jgi:hypothetical protein